jgi:hypothetical protein
MWFFFFKACGFLTAGARAIAVSHWRLLFGCDAGGDFAVHVSSLVDGRKPCNRTTLDPLRDGQGLVGPGATARVKYKCASASSNVPTIAATATFHGLPARLRPHSFSLGRKPALPRDRGGPLMNAQHLAGTVRRPARPSLPRAWRPVKTVKTLMGPASGAMGSRAPSMVKQVFEPSSICGARLIMRESFDVARGRDRGGKPL